MNKVNISELKAKLSEYLRQVRAGKQITIFDRNRPIAILSSIEEAKGLKIKPAEISPKEAFKDLQPIEGIPDDIDSLSLLLEDRAKR